MELPSLAVAAAAARRLNARHSAQEGSTRERGRALEKGIRLGSGRWFAASRLVWQRPLSIGVFWVLHFYPQGLNSLPLISPNIQKQLPIYLTEPLNRA